MCAVLETLSPIERDVYAGRVSEQLGVEKSAILAQLSEKDRKRRYTEKREELSRMEQAMTGSADRLDPTRAEHTRAAKAEETLLSMLLEHPERVDGVKSMIAPGEFVTAFNRRLYELLIELCAGGDKPSLMLMAAKLTPQEMASASRVFNAGGAPVPDDDETVRTCIDIIREEGGRLTGEALLKATDEQLRERMKALARKKKKQ